jgi:hypothetical protein
MRRKRGREQEETQRKRGREQEKTYHTCGREQEETYHTYGNGAGKDIPQAAGNNTFPLNARQIGELAPCTFLTCKKEWEFSSFPRVRGKVGMGAGRDKDKSTCVTP